MKLLTSNFKYFLWNVILLFLFNADVHCSNTWIGYESLEYPRTPGIQGTIDLEYISQFLPENPVIIEAGASIGTDTEKMAKRYPKGVLYSYEPVPRQFAAATKRCASLENVFLYNQALGEERGKALFFLSNTKDIENPNNGSSSLLGPSKIFQNYHPQFNFDKSITVDVVTLDDVFSKHNLDHVDLIWFDLQGFEPNVLRASSECLEKINAIYTEVSLVELYDQSELYPSFKNWMESNGFKVVREDLPYIDAGNVLFVKEHR